MRLPIFTFQQLRVFVSVAQEGSVTRAASQLGLSQPAASQAIRELERRVESELFERERNRLVLTFRGDQLLRRALALLEDAVGAEEELLGPPNVLVGDLDIGASTTIGNYILPELLVTYCKQHPHVRPRITIRHTRPLVEAVVAREVPFAFIEGRANHRDLKFTRFLLDELLVVCRAGHGWLDGPQRLDILNEQPFISREQGAGTRQIIEDQLEKSGVRLDAAIELGNTEALKTAVSAGLGFAILPRAAVRRELADGTLGAVDVVGLKLRRWLHTIVRKDRAIAPPTQALLRQLDIPH